MALRRYLSKNGSLLNKSIKKENTDIPCSFSVERLFGYRKERYIFTQTKLKKIKWTHIYLEPIKLNKFRKD
jgi:hypothetical protein